MSTLSILFLYRLHIPNIFDAGPPQTQINTQQHFRILVSILHNAKGNLIANWKTNGKCWQQFSRFSLVTTDLQKMDCIKKSTEWKQFFIIALKTPKAHLVRWVGGLFHSIRMKNDILLQLLPQKKRKKITQKYRRRSGSIEFLCCKSFYVLAT